MRRTDTIKGKGHVMDFTCDSCGTEYGSAAVTAIFLYIKDPRCNKIEATCQKCGEAEVIYLMPHRIEVVVAKAASTVKIHVAAEATSELRVRAEQAWATAEEQHQPQPVATTSSAESPSVSDELPTFQLTPRHEELLARFGDTLTGIPDDLLLDGFASETEQSLPQRWVDEP